MGSPGDVDVGVASTRPDDYAFDVFILHAADDRDFVHGYLVPALNLPAERVLLADELRLGAVIVSEIDRGISCSRFTVVVLSQAYLRDRWAVYGEQLAVHLSVEDGHVIPLRLADVKLPLRIDARVALDFTDRTRWGSEVARLRSVLHAAGQAAEPIPCPYPGMRPFAQHEASRFFGRAEEIASLVERLDHGEREVYVIGPSGSGKSSLVHAGLLPVLNTGSSRLGRSFAVRAVRPGERPNEQLAKALEGDPTMSATFDRLLACHPPATRLLVTVDPLDELFTLAGSAERQRFIDTLHALRVESRCHFVFTLRADLQGALVTSGLTTDDAGRSRLYITPLRGPSLAQAIVGPATEVGIHLERRLCDQLIADAGNEPGALPHVQVTLQLLWKERRLRPIGLAEYELLGKGGRGLDAVIARRAKDTMVTLTAAQQTIAQRLLLRLVVFGEGRADTRRQQTVRALQSAAEDDAEFSRVLQRLVEARLITIDGDVATDDAVVDLSHEALITVWPALRDGITQYRGDEQRRRRLEARASEWVDRGRGAVGLLDAMALSEAEQWMQSSAAQALGYGLDLPALVAASTTGLARAHRRRQRERLWSIIVILPAVVIALIAWNQWQGAKRRVIAQHLFEHGRAHIARRPMMALAYLIAAHAEGIERSSVSDLVAQATRALPLATVVDDCRIVNDVRFSPDGTRLVTRCDKTARIWDATRGIALTEPLEHDGTVTTALFSPDGTRVVTASEDHTARVWDAMTGQLVISLGHPYAVVATAFSTDGTRVITTTGRRRRQPPSSSDRFLADLIDAQEPEQPDPPRRHDATRVWDATTGQLMDQLEHPFAVTAAVFSPDAAYVATTSDQGIAQLWGIAGRTLLASFEYQYDVTAAAFRSDGAQLVIASATGIAQIWNVTDGKPAAPRLQSLGMVKAVAFSPDGTRLLTASDDHTARLWDSATSKQLTRPMEHRDIVAASFSSDGRRVVTASSDGTAQVWDATTGDPVSPPLEHGFGVTTAVFSPDGKQVATGGYDGTTPIGTTRVWGVARSALQHQDFIVDVAFSPDGRRVVTASADRTARVWDVANGRPITRPLEHHALVTRAAFSPDGKRIVTASADGTAYVWNVTAGGTEPRALEHRGLVAMAAFSPDGKRIVTASADGTARVWDAATGHPITTPLAHGASVTMAAFDRGGTRVLTTSGNTARVWNATTGKPITAPLVHDASVTIAAFNQCSARGDTAGVQDAETGKPTAASPGHRALITTAAFDPDGTHVITGGDDGTARVWDIATGQPVAPRLCHHGAVTTALFSPDGARALTASDDHTAQVWNATTSDPVGPRLEHRDIVMAAMFTPDGTRVVTASGDGTTAVWESSTSDLMALDDHGTITVAVFSPDGARIATASRDNTVRIWNLSMLLGSLEEWQRLLRCAPFVFVDGALQSNRDPLRVCPPH